MRPYKKYLSFIIAVILLCSYWLYTYTHQPINLSQPISKSASSITEKKSQTVRTLGNKDKKSLIIRGDLSGVTHERKLTEREKYAAYLNNHPFNQKKEEDDEEDESGDEGNDNPKAAWQQDFLRTMDPHLKRPTPEVLAAIAKQNHTISSMTRKMDGIPGTSASTQWTERGPNNVGGRTRALVWDPNDVSGKKVWAGGVSGGLWYNNDITDPNAPWTKVDDFWGNLSITAMVFDPNNKQIAYVATGEGFYTISSLGAGIWKTTNGGTNWTQITSTANFSYVNDMVVRNESGTSVIYAAVDGLGYEGVYHTPEMAGLQRSADGGATWKQVLPIIPGNTVNFVPASITIGAGNRLWVGTKESPYTASDRGGGRVLYSLNGINWTTSDQVTVANGTGRVSVACAPSDSSYVYSFVEDNQKFSAIRSSINNGISWSTVGTPIDKDSDIPVGDFSRGQAWYDQVIKVDPNNPTTLLVGCIDLFRSTNGGVNWTQISKWSNNNLLAGLTCSLVHSDHHAITYKPGSSDVVIFGNDGGVFYTSSVSTSATNNVISSRNKDYNVTQFYAAAMHPTAGSNVFLAGAQDNQTRKFSTAGINSATVATSGDGTFCFIDQVNPLYQITSQPNNLYFLSTDGGNTFSTLLSDALTGAFNNPSCYDNNQHVLYTYKSVGSIYRVKNITGSPSTTTINIGDLGEAVTAFRVSPYTTTSTTLYIGTSAGNLLKLTNADGSSITSSNIGAGLPVGSISCIEMGSSENELLVTFFNYGISKIWYTSDGGLNWVNKSGNFPNIPARWALFNPNLRNNEVILATELGIYGTTNFSNSSPTWSAVNTGFANVRTDMLQIRSSDNQVIAATYGRGLFSSGGFTAVGANNPPTITSFTPTSLTSGGTISITGTDFTGATGVSLGGTAVASFNVISSTNITAVVGIGTSGNVSVTTPAGTGTKSGFTFLLGPPTVSSFSPTSGGPGTLVTITGINLSGAISPTSVTFGGTNASVFTITSSTNIIAAVATGASGILTVTTTSGTAGKAGFTFVPAPTITAFSPTTAAAGATVTFTGTNFSNATDVSFGGTSAAVFTITSATDLIAKVGAGSIGDVSVTTAGGTASKSGFTFTTGGPPTFTAMSPTTGAVGTSVTITGTNFNPSVSGNVVYFGAAKANVTSASTTALMVTVPVGTTYQPVVVLDKATGLSASSSQPFMVTFKTKNSITSQDFANKVDFNTSSNSNGIALGDIDGDGKIDIVIANSNDNTVSVYRNTSVTGTITSSSFATKVDFATGFRPNWVALGDLDGDGRLDIVVSTSNSSTVTVLRNTSVSGTISSASFATKVDYSVGFIGSRSVAISDLDGDGKPDIAVVNGSRNTISVLRNTATPGNINNTSFSPRVDFTTGTGPMGIAIGDIDGDGKPDMLVANYNVSTVSIFRNTASSGVLSSTSFSAKVDLATSLLPQSVALSDVDGDGKADILVACNTSTVNVNVFRNINSPGSITLASIGTKVTPPTGGSTIPSFVAINDLDGDGKQDIMVANGNSGTSLSVYRNTSSSGNVATGFTSKTDVTVGNTPYSAVMGDIDGDGLPDLVALNALSGTLSVLRNTPQYPPTITSFTPATAGGGATITITGTDFAGAATVTLAGSPAASFTVLSSTTIVAIVGSGSGSTGNVSVTTPNGTGSLTGFTFILPPTIAGFSPTSATPGSMVTITGTTLTNVLTVTFGGTPAAAFTASGISMVAVVANGSSGILSVTTAGGTAGKSGFVFLPLPTITSFSPTSAGPGFPITITGTNFSGALSVTFGGTNATAFTVVSGTTINAIVGNGASGTVNVTTPVSTASLSGFTFYPAPTITSVLPLSAAAGNVVTITGTNLSNAFSVTFGGVNAAAFTITSPTEIKAQIGSGTSGIVSVSTPGGKASFSGFVFCPAPVVTTNGAASFCIGNNVILTSSVPVGTVTPTYQWYKEGVLIPSATSISYTASVTGTYAVGVNSANNCFAVSTGTVVTVNPLPDKPVITRTNADLQSSSSTGNQWSTDANTIAGATSQSYRPTISGYFKVVVTGSTGCVSPPSDLYYYLVTSIINISGNTIGTYKLVPNPTRERLFIQADNTSNRITIQMMDPNGRMMLNKEFTGSITIDMSTFAKGMYTILLTDSRTKKQESKQVIKQ